MTEHRAEVAELLVPAVALVAVAARREVVKANPVTGTRGRDLRACAFDDTGNFVPQREWQRSGR
jgi:hypothetical protein